MCIKVAPASQRGMTLIELVVFIVIVSVALAGVIKVIELTTKGSSDPIVTKQAISIARSLLDEINQQAFTYCDPDDANASTATSTADCTGGATNSEDQNGGTLGPMPTSESRYNNADPFDNVADYHGFTMPNANCAGICSPGGNGTGTVVDASLVGYSTSVNITRVGGTTMFPGVPLDGALRISIDVSGPANVNVNLVGYRVRYAPTL